MTEPKKPQGMWKVEDIPLEMTRERWQKYQVVIEQIEGLLREHFDSPLEAYGCKGIQ